MRKIFSTLIIAAVFLISCNNAVQEDNFVKDIEKAHQKDNFLGFDAIQFDLNLMFGERQRLNGTFTINTNSTKGIIQLSDSSSIYIDHDKVYRSPNFKNPQKVRFDAYTWSYFFLFPYKLSDPGTVWSAIQKRSLNNQIYYTQKLTFKGNVGDAPNDWYVAYADKATNLLAYAAYIVTANKSQEEAEEDPHAIEYKNYKNVGGIPIAHTWVFWEWRANKGLTKMLGKADISNVSLIKETKLFDTIPKGFVSVDSN